MLIGSKYKIDSDTLNFVLKEKYMSGEDETVEAWKTIGNYSTLKHLFIGLINHDILSEELEDIRKITEKINSLYILISIKDFGKDSVKGDTQ